MPGTALCAGGSPIDAAGCQLPVPTSMSYGPKGPTAIRWRVFCPAAL